MTSPGLRGRAGRARQFWIMHPRAAQALKATVSAAIAWSLVSLIPGPWSDYPYYAPLGAVVATSTTLASSTRQSLQAIAAIGLGALVARVIDLLPVPEVVSLALVVLIGVLVSGWRKLGEMGAWTTTTAIFVLIVGDPDPVGYVGAFVGLTFVGALVGIGVNAVAPSLPLTPTNAALDDLRATLADQLDALADSIEKEEPVDRQDPQSMRLAILPVRMRADNAIAHSDDAATGNWVARRYQKRQQQLRDQAAALDHAASTIEGTTNMVCEAQSFQDDGVALAAGLRSPAIQALRSTAAALRTLDAGVLNDDDRANAQNAVEQFEDALKRQDQPSREARVADGLAVALRQLLRE